MTPSLAHEPRSREQVAAAIGIIQEVLGDALAAWLYGSAVASRLRLTSDLDILVAVGRSLAHEEPAAIIKRLLLISGGHAVGGPGRPIELSIVALPSLIPWRYPPCIELQYGEWMRKELERGDLPDWPRPDPDVVVLLESARRASVPLFGPPIAALLEPVPRAHLAQAMIDLVPVLTPGIEDGDDIKNGLLTLARIWATLVTGEIRSKDEAARFVLARLPEEHRPVLAHALAAHLGAQQEDWRELVSRLHLHVEFVVEQIRALKEGLSGDRGPWSDQASFPGRLNPAS